MKKWNVDISVWHKGGDREIALEVEAKTSLEALAVAMKQITLEPDELLHVLRVHIGAPH